MPIELQFVAKVDQAIASINDVNRSLGQTTKEAGKISVAATKLTTEIQNLGKSQASTSSSINQTKVATLDAKDLMGAATRAAGFLAAELVILQKAFDGARDTAEQMGRSDVVTRIDAMTASTKALRETVVSMPVAGRDLLTWIRDASDGVTNFAKAWTVAHIQLQLWTGQITQSEAATLAAKLANAEYTGSLEAIKSKMTDVQKAQEVYRQELGKGLEEQRKQQQAGYIQYLAEQTLGHQQVTAQIQATALAREEETKAIGRQMFEAQKLSSILAALSGIPVSKLQAPVFGGFGFGTGAPSRDIGGRGKAGQPVVIGAGAQPEVFVPDSPGTFYPRGGGPASLGAAGAAGPVTNNITVNLTLTGTLGSRADAIRAGNAIGGQVARALGRAGSVPNGGLTRG